METDSESEHTTPTLSGAPEMGRTLQQGQHLVSEVVVPERADKDDSVPELAQRAGDVRRRAARVRRPGNLTTGRISMAASPIGRHAVPAYANVALRCIIAMLEQHPVLRCACSSGVHV